MPTCCTPTSVIENWALNNKFYVCTECHKEVVDMPPVHDEPFRTNPFTFGAVVYPGTPVPLAVETVEQLELFEPWVTGNLSFNNDKDDDNGKETENPFETDFQD